jgi:hypothetical protein
MRADDKNKHRYKRVELYLKQQEIELFQNKAAHHDSMSAMIKDAVAQYNDIATLGKIEAMTAMMILYKKYQNELSWLGGNFNQTVKRANELAIGQQLTPQFFEQVLYPQVEQIQALLHDIKREQHQIAKQLTHF